MSLVDRAPMTNHRNTNAKGVVRFIAGKGAGNGQADVNRSAKGVAASDKGNFSAGKGINRNSVFAGNNSGSSNGGGGKTRG